MFEQINENVATTIPETEPIDNKPKAVYKTFEEQLATADENVKILYQDLINYILSLGDDISETHLKLYAAFKKIKNVVTVVANKRLLLDPCKEEDVKLISFMGNIVISVSSDPINAIRVEVSKKVYNLEEPYIRAERAKVWDGVVKI